ncbi:MAG: tetratricopeptide repeat protein [Magnetococcales bacterium]|nr:tetratricopeptide repeat protein [Magnetococcales bacterium]
MSIIYQALWELNAPHQGKKGGGSDAESLLTDTLNPPDSLFIPSVDGGTLAAKPFSRGLFSQWWVKLGLLVVVGVGVALSGRFSADDSFSTAILPKPDQIQISVMEKDPSAPPTRLSFPSYLPAEPKMIPPQVIPAGVGEWAIPIPAAIVEQEAPIPAAIVERAVPIPATAAIQANSIPATAEKRIPPSEQPAITGGISQLQFAHFSPPPARRTKTKPPLTQAKVAPAKAAQVTPHNHAPETLLVAETSDPSKGKGGGGEIVIESSGSDPDTRGIGPLTQVLFDAMDAGDAAEVAKGFQRLQSLLGADNPFVKKTQAYWRLQQKDYPRAYGLLQEILTDDPTDLESHLNMVMAEIGTGRNKSAAGRLQKLLEQYPTHPKVQSLMAILGYAPSVRE